MPDKWCRVAVWAAFFLGFLIALLGATGCAPKHVEAKAPVVDRPLYSYTCAPLGTCVVWIRSGSDAEAREEICTKAYVCKIEPSGRVVTIERVRK